MNPGHDGTPAGISFYVLYGGFYEELLGLNEVL